MADEPVTELAARTKMLAEKWSELEDELVLKLHDFAAWTREKFPNPSTYEKHPARHLYPVPWPSDWVKLSSEEPIEMDAFVFIDGEQDGDGPWYLPLAWLRDPEGFHQAVLTKIHAEEREAEGRKARARATEVERLRKRLAELESQ